MSRTRPDTRSLPSLRAWLASELQAATDHAGELMLGSRRLVLSRARGGVRIDLRGGTGQLLGSRQTRAESRQVLLAARSLVWG